MNTRTITGKKILYVSCFVLVAMLIGSLYDYQISCLLFNEGSVFGKVMASFGQLPVAIGNSVIGCLLFYVTQRRFKITTVLSYVFAALSYLMAIVTGAMDPMLYLEISIIPALCIAIVEVAIVTYITYRMAIGVDRREIKRFIAFLAFVIYGQLIVINMIKPLAARPRMRMIAVTPEASFQPWWVFGSGMKDTLMESYGILSEEFKSFPSGHSGCAAVAMAYCLVPVIRRKGSSNLWFCMGLVFALIVMFSRIIVGAHFLSDVIFGFAITFVIITIGIKLFYGGSYEETCI